jgi:predicted PurR-regulated permease PerM
MKREPARKLISLVVLSNKAFSGFISGQCIEVLLIGILCFIGMLIFKMPYAIMVSCIIAFTAFIPVFGPFIGTAIGGFLILIENPIQALWFVLFIIILQQLESNIIYPKIMGKHVGLPGIWVLISVTIGGGLFGVVGIITSVPICSVLYTLFDKWIKRRLEERNICHRTMSHDSSEPKSIIEEMNLYEFEADYGYDFDDDEDDVYTDDGELRKIYDTDQNSTDAEKDDADINTPLDKQDAEDK